MKHWNKNFRRVLTMAAVAAMLVTTAAAASTVTKRTIEANYMGIKLVIDGQEVTPKDASGNVVEPFTSNGTTYQFVWGSDVPALAPGEKIQIFYETTSTGERRVTSYSK